MTNYKTWAVVHFCEGDASIELTINYQTGHFTLTHGNNDNNVTFNGEATNMKVVFDRLKCVKAALKYAKTELL